VTSGRDSRQELSEGLRRLLEPFAEELAGLLLKHLDEAREGPPLAVWPGSARQLRRTLERLRARGIAVDTFAIGRRYYLRTADLERLPGLLAERPATLQIAGSPANDRVEEEDVEASGERFAEQLLAARGKRLGAPRAAGRGGR
jgi:hypothetical protein